MQRTEANLAADSDQMWKRRPIKLESKQQKYEATMSERHLQQIHARSSISELLQARQVQRSLVGLSAVDKDSDSGSIAKEPVIKKMKQFRDPQTHRIIEKRRRDRMNQSLNDLSRLIPAAYLKQGQSRVEKAEIIELATQHIVALSAQVRKCEAALGEDFPGSESSCCTGKVYQGFREASKSALAYLTEQESFSSNDPLCSKLRAHLHSLSQRLLPADLSTPPKTEGPPASPASTVSCSTDEAHSEALFDSGAACPASAVGEATGPLAATGGTGAASSRRDPKSNFRARFEAEASATNGRQQDVSGRKRKLKADHDDTEVPSQQPPLSRHQPEPVPTGPSQLPGLDYRDRVRLLDRGTRADVFTSAAEDDAELPAEYPAVGEALLPGFVLHESGTYYEPVVIPPACLGAERVVRQQLALGRRRGPLHPVSIPVNFRITRFVQSGSQHIE